MSEIDDSCGAQRSKGEVDSRQFKTKNLKSHVACSTSYGCTFYCQLITSVNVD